MPIDVARPSGAGAFTEWTSRNVSGAPVANHAAVSSGSSNQFVEALSAGLRDRYQVPPLPGTATGVGLVTIYALVAGDDVGTVRMALRLGGVESYGSAVVPPTGGFQLVFFEFPLAPGGLAWTVARRNAIEFGPDSVMAPDDAGNPLTLDEGWIQTSYTDPDAEPSVLERVGIPSPAGGRIPITAPARRVTIASPAGARMTITAPVSRVTIPVPAGGRIPIRLLPERD